MSKLPTFEEEDTIRIDGDLYNVSNVTYIPGDNRPLQYVITKFDSDTISRLEPKYGDGTFVLVDYTEVTPEAMEQ